MRVDQKTLQAHRSGILAAAGKLFRLRGVDAVPVAEIMKEAGLTHGGFYGHYPSKAALAASACRLSLADSAVRWRQKAAQARDEGQDPIAVLVAGYLHEERLACPETSCVIPALGMDAWRAGPPLSTALAAGVQELTAVLTAEAPPHTPDPHGAALAAMAALVGGMIVARASADMAQARDVLAAARGLAMRAFDAPPEKPSR